MLAKVSTLLLVSMLLLTTQAITLADDAAFQRTWERTDRPVAGGQAARTWMWGPESFSGTVTEEYLESPGGTREVRYFDKSRMEVTNPGAVDDSLWYVTNGLLVVELVSGNMQTGHDSFETRVPADVPVAGDSDDPDGPTYATFAALLDAEPATFGETISERVNRAGEIIQDSELGTLGITAVHIDGVTNHAIAGPFREFMNSTGTVWQDGAFTEDILFQDPLFATGRPVTEAYWATVKVANSAKDVLVQCFERRCLTYTPENDPGWQVEAGNVGRHYHIWRYDQTEPEPEPEPDPPFPGVISVSTIQGVEIAAGTVDEETSSATFIGSSTGDVSGSFRAEIHYTPPNPGAGVTNTVVGGTWSITGEEGSVSGVFTSGAAQWDANGDVAEIHAIMSIESRSGNYQTLPASARFDGELFHTVFPPRISGTLIVYR